MIEPMTIYVAGPYSADSPEQRLENTYRAVDAGIELLGKDHYPFVPHLTHFVEQRAKQLDVELTWEDYVEWDVRFLEFCDGFLYLDSSPGADLELEYARNHGLEIFHSISSVPEADRELSEEFPRVGEAERPG